MDVQLKKGLLELCVLRSLVTEESYGYKIIKDVNEYIEISESTLYPILRRLENSNCLETYNKEYNNRLRKYYKITNKGLEKLENSKKNYETINKIYKFILGGNNNE